MGSVYECRPGEAELRLGVCTVKSTEGKAVFEMTGPWGWEM